MQHCVEIAEDFQSGKGLQGLFLHFQDKGFNDLLSCLKQNESGASELHSSRYSENLYNRSSILGVDMSSYLGCKNFFTSNGKH
jgi:hypothetical protein